MEPVVTVELQSAVGPRVLVRGEIDEADIEAQLPEGWTVGSNWHNGVKLRSGGCSYPLVRSALKSTSYRLDPETKRLIAALAAHLAVGGVDVLRVAVRGLAKKEGVK